MRSRAWIAVSMFAAAASIVATTFGGCANSAKDAAYDAPGPDAALDGDGDTRVQGVEVLDDAKPHVDLCGLVRLCDPDVPAICTPLGDGGFDAPPPSGDGDEETGPTTFACRVVVKENRPATACAPAGNVLESQFCKSDDECAPGLACVGDGRCLRYCCKAYDAPGDAGDAGAGTHYCTPRPLFARPSDKVPVWVKLDNCTLLADEAQCPKGTTCTVVTNDGKTTCVQAGSGRDWAPCDEEPCDRGYVCLGTVDRRCRKLCREAEGATGCPGGGHCQRVPTIPTGYGICSGGDAGSK